MTLIAALRFRAYGSPVEIASGKCQISKSKCQMVDALRAVIDWVPITWAMPVKNDSIPLFDNFIMTFVPTLVLYEMIDFGGRTDSLPAIALAAR